MLQKLTTALCLFILFCYAKSDSNGTTISGEEADAITEVIKESEIESNKGTFDKILEVNEHAHLTDYLYEGDIRLNPFRNANGRKWEKSRDGLVYVPYVIGKEYNTGHRASMKQAFDHFQKHTCIRFVPRKSQRGYLSIESQGGCWSYVGNIGRKQTVSLNKGFFFGIGGCVSRGTIMHELMHAIGFEHEQSRSDRDKYITVLTENISGGGTNNNFFKHPRTQNLVIYDYTSIMHYSSSSFAKHRVLKAIEIYPKRKPEPTIGFRSQMSAYDIEEIKYYYGCRAGTYTRCGRDFVNLKSGSFHSPSYPRYYPDEAHCTWNITVRRGRFVEVIFTDINIQTSNLCQLDAIVAHNGRNAGAPVIERICGRRSSLSLTSTTNNMFVMFTSAGRREMKGFRATFKEVTTRGTPPPAIPTEAPVPVIRTFSSRFRCNFDSNICGMTQDTTDDMNYSLRGGSTPSRLTGPSADHTSGRGRYIYLESSSGGFGSSAIIRSPWFRRASIICVAFSYHMYGRSIGGLRVYAFEKKRSIRTGQRNMLWEKFDDQGNRWINQRITYRPSSSVEHMQFYWKGYIGREYSDIAIDDIDIYPGACSSHPPPPSPTTPSVPITVYPSRTCNFETGLCGFVQLLRDQFNWSRRRGATPTLGSGPSGDHTTGRGYYMYIEASAPRRAGNIARLESPGLTYSTHCLNMWYHMNGKDIGKLTIYKEIKGVKYIIREVRGSKGDIWKRLQVEVNKTVSKKSNSIVDDDNVQNNPIRSKQYIKVVIEATVGPSSHGDIAIDDIVITDRSCTSQPTPSPVLNKFSCNFDTGSNLCGLQQARNDRFDWTRRSGGTRTGGTGPSVDNTQKTASGFYIYIEASTPRVVNDVAKLLTPRLRAGSYCVQFAYHMFGTAIGRLSVLSLEGSVGEPRVRWMSSTNHGNQWQQTSFDYTSLDGDKSIQFLFYGVVGRSSSGDIALDDVNITSGSCSNPGRTTPGPARTTTPSAITTTTRRTTPTTSTIVRPPPIITNGQQLWSGMPLCTFENKPSQIADHRSGGEVRINAPQDLGSYVFPSNIQNDPMCGWFQFDQYDNFDWTRHRGSTPSSNTGPTGDKTTGRGQYMYIESSTPRKPNDVAFLQAYFMPASDYCVDLNYHMFGANMGKLRIRTVQTLRNGTRRRPMLKELANNRGNQWRNTKTDFVPYASAMTVAFRLEGIVGSGSESDIAIDDITVLPGRCNACQNPTHRFTISNRVRRFSAGCVHTGLFYVRCCDSAPQKAAYRRVRECNGNMFSSSQLNRFCQN